MGQEILIRDIPIYEGDLVDGKHVYKGKTNDDFKRLINGILEGGFAFSESRRTGAYPSEGSPLHWF